MKDITPRNQKGQQHGYCEWHWLDGSVAYKGFFNNGKRIGYSESYSYLTDKLNNKTYYI